MRAPEHMHMRIRTRRYGVSPKQADAFGRVFAKAFPQVIMSNFYGMPAGTYYVHHCIMHHQANNFFPYDISSTMP